MMKRIISRSCPGLLIVFYLVAACARQPTTVAATIAPSKITETPSFPPQCAWNWATQSLPEVSEQLQAAFDKAGLTGIIALAEAYGENCYDGSTDKVVYFATMETDFKLVVQVESLADKSHLGDMVERILKVIDEFPPGVVPGPQPGYVGITFERGEDTIRLWFTIKDGEKARADGLSGRKLLENLMEK